MKEHAGLLSFILLIKLLLVVFHIIYANICVKGGLVCFKNASGRVCEFLKVFERIIFIKVFDILVPSFLLI